MTSPPQDRAPRFNVRLSAELRRDGGARVTVRLPFRAAAADDRAERRAATGAQR